MTKYNVGDILEITESFFLEGAQYEAGQKYTVEDVFAGYDGEDFYTLDDKESGYHFTNRASLVDAHSGFSKVEPKVEFKVGDKVRLLEGAHGNPDLGYFWSTEEGFAKQYGYRYDLVEPFVVQVEIDYAGEVGISQDGLSSYVLSEFLVPWDEEEKPAEHMELGGKYWNPEVGVHYTVTGIDFESERVQFVFNGNQPTNRSFRAIPLDFNGVLPPVKPATQEVDVEAIAEAVQEEVAKVVGEVKPENSLASAVKDGKAWRVNTPQPVGVETVSVEALWEALDFLGIQEVFDTENIISLAKRLS